MNLPAKAKEALDNIAANDPDFETYIGLFSNGAQKVQSRFIKKHGNDLPQDMVIIRDGLILHLMARIILMKEELESLRAEVAKMHTKAGGE